MFEKSVMQVSGRILLTPNRQNTHVDPHRWRNVKHCKNINLVYLKLSMLF